jgi:uncharacterized protein YktB (UPF0637 family)
MIIIDKRFTKDLKRHNFDLINKGRVLDAICVLLDDPDLGRGIRKKGANYFFDAIGKKWQLNFNLSDGNIHLLNLWDHDKGIDNKKSSRRLEKDSPKNLNVTNGVVGFSAEDFRTLEWAFQIPDQISEKEYFQKIYDQIFPKFDSIGKNISFRLYEELGVRLFPHKSEMGDIGKGPVTWLAFTRSRDEHYQNYAQLTLHLGIGDCTHETNDFNSHFCIKLAVFHDKHDTRAFWRNLQKNPNAITLIKKYARKLNESYEMRFYRRKRKPPMIFPTHTNDETYSDVFIDLMNPESISEDFFGFSFSRYYPFYENDNQEKFSNMQWVEAEIVNEFADLMYLYFMFADDDPIQRIHKYKQRKIPFNNRKLPK